MVSIMLPCRKFKRYAPMVLMGLLVATSAVAGEFRVKNTQAWLADKAVIVTADMDLVLGEDVEAALTSGIPLDILIEFAVYRARWFWDKRLGQWTLRAQVKYHALSGLYIVTLQNSGESRSFATQSRALKYVGTLDRVSLPVTIENKADSNQYWLEMRVLMDVEALPVPLRPLAYLATPWHLNSDWTRWSVETSPAS
ncbi:MAG TPA: DUF4390 domain-containing protein [Acidiferrobacteraceae bacterium]|nr:DUF4390 domain-containing protein [Acidiferrobacteraceae bacterium]